MASGMTVTKMLALEPRLKKIADTAEREAETARNPWPVYGRAKAAADNLVGRGAEKKELKTPAAYECFIKYLVDRMGI